MKIRSGFLAAFTATFLWTPMGSSAQVAPGQASSSTITLDVVVSNKSGAPVADLLSGNFKLLDKKQPQNLISVQFVDGASAKTDAPAEAILVVDAVNGSLETVESERQMLAPFSSGKPWESLLFLHLWRSLSRPGNDG